MENNITNEILDRIEDYASLLFSPEEICIILELPISEYKHRFLMQGDAIYNKYQTGKLKRIATQRKMIFKLAEEGSSPAQAEVNKMIQNLESKES